MFLGITERETAQEEHRPLLDEEVPAEPSEVLDKDPGYAIPMQYATTLRRTLVTRYFSTDLPPALAEKGVSKKEYQDVVKKVNAIWTPWTDVVRRKAFLVVSYNTSQIGSLFACFQKIVWGVYSFRYTYVWDHLLSLHLCLSPS